MADRLPPRPQGQKFYGPLIEHTLTEGWCLGVISEHHLENETHTLSSGDAYIVAPDGDYCGLVWSVGQELALWQIDGPRSTNLWGVYEVYFLRPIGTADDLRREFRAVLPHVQETHRSWKAGNYEWPWQRELDKAATLGPKDLSRMLSVHFPETLDYSEEVSMPGSESSTEELEDDVAMLWQSTKEAIRQLEPVRVERHLTFVEMVYQCADPLAGAALKKQFFDRLAPIAPANTEIDRLTKVSPPAVRRRLHSSWERCRRLCS